MKLTKEQVYRLYVFLNVLVADDTDIKNIKFMGSDIIVNIEPIKGGLKTEHGELLLRVS